MRRFSIFSLLIFFMTSEIAAKNVIEFVSVNKYEAMDSGPAKSSTQIRIIKNYKNITSISKLLDLFKNKPVLIDLWATWCSPCLEEFKFSKSLFNFLSQNEVELVYVSLDKEFEDLLWRKNINENKLSGNHIRASKILQDELTTLIWGGIDAFSIPHYILFDKNKKIVNKDLSAPSSGLKLFKEIEFGLK